MGKKEQELEIKKGESYALRKQTSEEIEAQEEVEAIPEYRVKLDLSKQEEEDFIDQVWDEFDALVKEREELKLEDKWDELDRQYDGELKSNEFLAFNLHVQQSKIKVDAITRALNEAFLDSDPMFDISPRPDTARKDGYEVAEQQQQFLDFAVDEEICPEIALTKINKCAVTKFVGIGKLSWEYLAEKRRREESYEGNAVPIGVTKDNQIITKNEGLEKFLKNYPEGLKKHKAIIRELLAKKKVSLVVKYEDVVSNNPVLKDIQLKNFYVRNTCEYWEGLKTEHCIVERQNFSYWELKKKEANGELEDVDRLFMGNEEGQEGEGEYEDDYMTATYDVLEVTTYRKMQETDEEEVKVKAWFGEKKKIYLGGEIYPYYGFDTDYIPFYVKLNEDGFYGGAKSVMLDLRDSNIAQDVLLNLLLHGMYIRNMVTPIAKEGSEIEDMFLGEQKFISGKPLIVDAMTEDVRKEVGFVNWPNMDSRGALTLIEKLKRIDSDVSRVSDLTSGQESALDPTAPAAKTIALLEQSGVGIRDYIRTYLPSFNVLAFMVLQLYYQMSDEDKQFKVVSKSKKVTGDNPFKTISREDMIVKTNIQSRAAAFVFDKMNEKREALAAYQVVEENSYAKQLPNLRYKALKVLLETMGSRWKTIVETDLPTPQEFEEDMELAAMKAIQTLMQMAKKQGETSGVDPKPGEVMEKAPGAVAKTQMLTYEPELAEEQE